jgi:delta24-sterol reductase
MLTTHSSFAGTSGESSSYKYGLFDRTVRGVEIILGNGEVVWASAEEHRDLFFTAASELSACWNWS